MSRIVAYVPDVMDRSKVAAAADCIFVSRPADLAGLCAGLHRDRLRDLRATDEELAMRAADEEEPEEARVEADVHPKRHDAD